MGLKFIDTFSYLPEKRISNQYFEDYLDTTDQWISERTGISYRHFYDGSMMEMIKDSCQNIHLQNKEEIKAVIVASCTTKYQIPALASVVAGELGLSGQLIAMDINQACTGFVAGMELLDKILEVGGKAILIGAEKFSDVLDFEDRSTAVIFGDGIGGAIVEKTDGKGTFISYTNPNSDALIYSEEKCGLQMEGRDVYRFVTRDVLNSLEQFLEEHNIDKDRVTFVAHQANGRILEALARRLDVDSDKVPSNIKYTGNISSGSIPILLDQLNKEDKLKRGEDIVFMAFGAGLSWSFGHITW